MSENLHPRADEIDDLSALEFVALMHAEDVAALNAITPRLEDVARAVEAVTERLSSGGRLHYFGAGTSGLIAELDAAECPATFGVAGDRVLAHSVEDTQEDDRDLGGETARRAAIGSGDVVVGISASGRTPFVLGAFERAAVDGPLRIAVTCKPGSPLGQAADIAIEVDKGPEVIAGSTRLKAGTVQKVILNMLSTAVFTRLAHTHRGRMVGVVASNEKQRGRAAGVVADLGAASREEAVGALEAARGNVKVAIVMLRRGLNPDEARLRLDAAGGDLKVVLAEARRP
ncbi:MAG: N-acetylmuramic acid 6-phosphate etherase [Chloroflexi bacterium]|nr:MAG: N-acetylmuramic acid 6-phosphate etherase [Chloroflexota bacterium]